MCIDGAQLVILKPDQKNWNISSFFKVHIKQLRFVRQNNITQFIFKSEHPKKSNLGQSKKTPTKSTTYIYVVCNVNREAT